jgi:C1A family cysteine protease
VIESSTRFEIDELGVADDDRRLLLAMGVTSIEDFNGLVDAVPAETQEAFDLDVWSLNERFTSLGFILPPQPEPPTRALAEPSGLRVPLGFAPTPVTRDEILGIAAAASGRTADVGTTTIVDLRHRCRPVRDQGDRKTCVGHALAAATEIALGSVELSPNFVYYQSKQRDGYPGDAGTWLKFAAPSLQQAGVCLEPLWPYSTDVIAGNLTHGSPTAAAVADATGRLAKTVTRANITAGTNVQGVTPRQAAIDALDHDLPVVVGVGTFPSWNSAETWRTGKFTLPAPGTTPSFGHAMCFVGYGYAPAEFPLDPEFFIVRNSYGTGFARDSPFEPGYGMLPAGYLDAFSLELAIVGY